MEHLDHYTCAQVFQRLDDFLDRELSQADVALVEEHLQTCAACAAEYDFESEVLTQIRRKLRHLDVPVDLVERILQQLPPRPSPEA